MPIIKLPYSANARPAPNNTRNAESWIGSIGSQVSTSVLSGKRRVVLAYTTSTEPLIARAAATYTVIQNRQSDVNVKKVSSTATVASCETPDRAEMGEGGVGVIGRDDRLPDMA